MHDTTLGTASSVRTGTHDTDLDTTHSVRRETADEPGRGWRLSWGAIFAGAIIVLSVQLLLSLLGIGIGMGMVEPAQGGTPAAESFGLGAGIWWVLSYLVALIAGGYVAARLASSTVPLDGMLQGLVTWAVALMFTIYLLSSAVGGIMGGAFNVLGSTLSGSGEALRNAAPQVTQAVGVSADPLGERASQLLRTASGPTDPALLAPQQAEDEVAALLPQLAGGDEQAAAARDRITTIMSVRLGISKQEADTRLGQTQAEIDQAKVQATDTATRATENTASGLSWASILSFLALALGAAAAAFGGNLATKPRHAVTTVVNRPVTSAPLTHATRSS